MQNDGRIHGIIETPHWSISTVLWVFWMIVVCLGVVLPLGGTGPLDCPLFLRLEMLKLRNFQSSEPFGPLVIGVATQMSHLPLDLDTPSEGPSSCLCPLPVHVFIEQAAGLEEPQLSLHHLDRWCLVLWNSWEIDPPVPKGRQR